MDFIDLETNEKFMPYIIESTLGADRLTLVLLFNLYNKQELSDGAIREYMKFHPSIVPYKVAVLPLIKKYHVEKVKELFNILNKDFTDSYGESGSIGKRYRRQDMLGRPFCSYCR